MAAWLSGSSGRVAELRLRLLLLLLNSLCCGVAAAPAAGAAVTGNQCKSNNSFVTPCCGQSRKGKQGCYLESRCFFMAVAVLWTSQGHTELMAWGLELLRKFSPFKLDAKRSTVATRTCRGNRFMNCESPGTRCCAALRTATWHSAVFRSRGMTG